MTEAARLARHSNKQTTPRLMRSALNGNRCSVRLDHMVPGAEQTNR